MPARSIRALNTVILTFRDRMMRSFTLAGVPRVRKRARPSPGRHRPPRAGVCGRSVVRLVRQLHTNSPASPIAWGFVALGEYKLGAVHPEGSRALDGGIAGQLEVRECRPDDDDAALALRNQVFPPIGPEDWNQSQTAAVARLDGGLVG